MQEEVRGNSLRIGSAWLGLALLLALMLLTPWGRPVKLSSAPLGPPLQRTSAKSASSPAASLKPELRQKVVESYLHLPLIFEANQGQTDPRVKFISRGDGYSLFLTDHNAVLELSQARKMHSKRPASGSQQGRKAPAAKIDVLRFDLAGSSPAAQATGLGELPGKSNYFIGQNPAHWHTGIPQYSKVAYNAIYPGVNLVYYGSQGHLEYDFDVSPGASPAVISLSIDGLAGAGRRASETLRSGLGVDSQGNLVMATPAGTVRFAKPVAYQVSRQGVGVLRKNFVKASYVVKKANRHGQALVGFQVGSYDKGLPLVIDPVLTYSTYIGGSLLDRAQSVALDSSGNAYVTGNTLSLDFPNVPGSIQPGGCGGTCLGNVFVMELTPSTSTLVYSTYLGGSGDDTGYGIAVDATGNAFVTGEATSKDFPVTLGTYQSTCALDSNGACQDAFASQLKPGGASLAYSTYFGGNGDDEANAIALDNSDDVYIGGVTFSTTLPTTPGAFQTQNNGNSDGFFTILNFNPGPGKSALVYSTYLGGSGADSVEALAFDSARNVYLTGETTSKDFPITKGAYQTQCILTTNQTCEGDAFVSKINPTATGSSALVYSTRLGGTGEEAGNGIVVDSLFDAYITGFTTSATDFPVQNPYQATFGGLPQDAFVTKFKPDGSGLIFSTYLGGNTYDLATGIALGPDNTVYVVGSSNSTNFPITANALYSSLGQGTPGTCNNAPCRDVTVTSFDSSGTGLLFSTYLGGGNEDEGNGIVVDSSGTAYVTGFTQSVNPIPFPTQNPTTAACVGTCGPTGTSNPGDAFLSELGSLTTPFALFSTTTVSFGNQNVGSKSSPQTVTLTNSGNANLTISSVVLGGSNPTDFTETDNCVSSSPLIPGASCTANVTFGPLVIGPLSASLTVTDTATNSPQTISLSGTGIQVSIAISPTSLNFAGQAPGTTSAPQPVTLTNTGTGTITLTSVVITGPFALASGTTCAANTQLTTNQNCVMNVTFSPTSLGPQSGAVTLTDNAPGSPQTVPLTGNGSAAGVVFSPASLSFGNVATGQSSTAQTVTITNNGNINLVVTGVSFTGTNPGDFSDTNGCTTVAPNAKCTITVTFKPAAAGARSASLSVTDNAPASPQSVPLTGTGTGPGAALSPPTGLNFGGQTINTASNPQTVTLTNTGTSALTITGITVIGTNPTVFSESNTCGTSLAANANCAISVIFKPATGGNLAATLSVADNAPGSPQTVPLAGTGADFAITATTTTQTVAPGANAVYQLSLTPQGGFNQAVSLACSGQPAASTCTVAPPSVTPNSNGSATPLTVTVVTTAASLAPPFSHLLPPATGSGHGWVWMMSLLGLLMFTTLLAQRKTRRAAWILAPVMLWILMASACGSNSTGSGGGGTAGTPPGTYTLKVSGTAGSLTSSVNVSLTVN